MEDGDLGATVATTSGQAVVVTSRRASSDAAAGVATSITSSDAIEVTPVAFDKDVRPLEPSVASDRRAAIVELMREHGDSVFGFCIRVLGDYGLAEEVRQQTFLEAFRDFDRFPVRSSRRAWLFGIASHRSMDVLRNQQRRLRWIENDDEAVVNTRDPRTGPSEQIEQAQLTSALEECLKFLAPEVRMTVLMRFQTDLTYEELAGQLSTRAEALQMRVTRALPKLRRCLESKGVFDD